MEFDNAFLAAFFNAFGVKNTYSKACVGVGFTYGLNKPFSEHYSSGHGLKSIGSLPLILKFALIPYSDEVHFEGDYSLVFK